jgi:hypothetical protein
MHFDFGKLPLWPLAFAALFFVIPPLLFHSYPSSFWANNDYEPLGLANAMNMAYRLADLKLYPAVGITDHPGIPFYFMSWLALAFSGYPVAFRGPGFFTTVADHVEDFHRISIWLAALVGASGVYIFARIARSLVPTGVVAIGLLVWLVSTPATLLMFTSPSIESFALLINGLFFWVLVRVAYDRNITAGATVFAACVSAFAYLNKLSYINVSLALAATGILNLFFRDAGWTLGRKRCVLFTLTSLAVIVVVGCLSNGVSDFLRLLRFHKNVVFNSGMYGTGDQFVVSGHDIWRALAAIPLEKAYALPVALIVGAVLAIGGLLTARRGPEHIPVAVICIGAGLASAFSAVFVIKHYNLYYTAGVSSTLPASAVALYLLVQSWGYKPRIIEAALVAILVLLAARETVPAMFSDLEARMQRGELAKADLQDIDNKLADRSRVIEFLYKTPFSWYGEGFVIYNANVPRLTEEYRQNRPKMFSASVSGLHRDPDAYVIDKGYFPTAESVKTSRNLAVIEPIPVTFESGDKLVELRTTFLLIHR